MTSSENILAKKAINIRKATNKSGRSKRSTALMMSNLRRSKKAKRRMIIIRGAVDLPDLDALVAPVRAVGSPLAAALEGAEAAAALDHLVRASPTYLATMVVSPTPWTCHGR